MEISASQMRLYSDVDSETHNEGQSPVVMRSTRYCGNQSYHPDLRKSRFFIIEKRQAVFVTAVIIPLMFNDTSDRDKTPPLIFAEN